MTITQQPPENGTPEQDTSPTSASSAEPRETVRRETPRESTSGRGLSFWKPTRDPMPDPKPVPRWMVASGERALFGLPVVLLAVPFSPRLPEFGLPDPLPAALDLAAILAVVFGAGAAIHVFVSSGRGAALRRFGARAKDWFAAGSGRLVRTLLALLGLWAFTFQLPRLFCGPVLVAIGSFVFCLPAAFAIFTAALTVAAGKEKVP